jgi:RNA polymerase sigma-70 factor (ECF subfamily)
MKSVTPSDGELVQLIVAGEERAFITVYRRHQAQIFRFALLMSGSHAIAEDVTQEVFMALVREPARYDASRGALSAYLYGIARNYVLRCIDRDRSYISIVDEFQEGGFTALHELTLESDPLDDLARSELVRSVRQAVLALPPRYRDVVVLCDFQELSYAEAAAVLGRPVGTICSRLHRGHSLLLEKLRSSGHRSSQAGCGHSVRCFA